MFIGGFKVFKSLQKAPLGGSRPRAIASEKVPQSSFFKDLVWGQKKVPKKTLLIKGKIDPASCGPQGFVFFLTHSHLSFYLLDEDVNVKDCQQGSVCTAKSQRGGPISMIKELPVACLEMMVFVACFK